MAHARVHGKSLRATTYTRGEFFALAFKACHVLRTSGVKPGDSHTHFFSCNTLGDLAFRLASVLCGTVPVTINWQADTPERVLYKVQATRSKLVLFDDGTPADHVLSMNRFWRTSAKLVRPHMPPDSLASYNEQLAFD